MSERVDIIEKIGHMVSKDKDHNEKVFHRAKLLLCIYRDVVWRVEDIIYDVDAQAYDFGGRKIAQLLDYLSYDFEGDMDKILLEKRLINIDETRTLIDIVEKGLVKLKTYPHYGDLYFQIITNKFIYQIRYTDEELIELLDIGHTMYYRRKKEAVNLMGVILWGYILPQLKDYWSKINFDNDGTEINAV